MQVTMGKEKHISVAKLVSNYPPIITHTEFNPRDLSRDKTVSNHLQHSHIDQMQQREVNRVNKHAEEEEFPLVWNPIDHFPSAIKIEIVTVVRKQTP